MRSRKALSGGRSISLAALLERGMIDEVEVRIASTTDGVDALTWATMRRTDVTPIFHRRT